MKLKFLLILIALAPLLSVAQKTPDEPPPDFSLPCGFNPWTGQIIHRSYQECKELERLPRKYNYCRTVTIPLQQCINDVNADITAEQRQKAVDSCLVFNQKNWLKQYAPYGTLNGPGRYSYAQWQGFVEYWCEIKPSFNLLGG